MKLLKVDNDIKEDAMALKQLLLNVTVGMTQSVGILKRTQSYANASTGPGMWRLLSLCVFPILSISIPNACVFPSLSVCCG